MDDLSRQELQTLADQLDPRTQSYGREFVRVAHEAVGKRIPFVAVTTGEMLVLATWTGICQLIEDEH